MFNNSSYILIYIFSYFTQSKLASMSNDFKSVLEVRTEVRKCVGVGGWGGGWLLTATVKVRIVSWVLFDSSMLRRTWSSSAAGESSSPSLPPPHPPWWPTTSVSESESRLRAGFKLSSPQGSGIKHWQQRVNASMHLKTGVFTLVFSWSVNMCGSRKKRPRVFHKTA